MLYCQYLSQAYPEVWRDVQVKDSTPSKRNKSVHKCRLLTDSSQKFSLSLIYKDIYSFIIFHILEK